MTELFYTPDRIEKFIEAFTELKRIDEEAGKKKAEVLGAVMGRPVLSCEQCKRPMLPRRLWDNLPLHERPKSCARYGNEKLCHPHLLRFRRKNGLIAVKTLSETDLLRLRKEVGFG